MGIGASVAIFTLADNLLLRPLPYREPDRLTMVWEVSPQTTRNVVSPANHRDWKAQSHEFEAMAAFGEGSTGFADGSRAEELQEQSMTADLLPMLGVQPMRGRLFTAAEDQPNSAHVVLISYRLWQSWFAGNDGAIGRTVQMRSRPVTIIGVMPPGFYFRNRNVDLWEPLGLDPVRDYRKDAGRYLMCVARLKPGLTLEGAQSRMRAIARRLETDYPRFNTNWTVNVEPLRDSLVSQVKTSMLVLLGAVGLLLAVACANVANLLLARYTARRREMAVRLAIGAGRGRVVRQLITESVVLGLAGGILGAILARWTVAGLLVLAPVELSRNIAIAADYRIVLFALGVPMLTGVLFGLAPSLVASRADLTLGLREGGRGSVGGAGRLRAGLVAAEMALSVILLAGAGLLFRSLVGLQGVDPGLNPAHMLTFRVQIPPARYRTPADRTQFFTRALEQLERLPGVESASAISYLPFNGMAAGTDLAIAGRPPAKPGAAPVATIRTVMPEYFRTVGIPLRKGRAFTAADNAPDSPYRFVVNQAFVEKYLAGEEPLGQQVSVDMDDRNPFGEIIGVVALVLGSGMRVVLSGAIVGTGGALALTGLLKSLLFGVQAQDPATFALVPAVLIAVALLSAYLPARRASRLAPVEALKLE